MRKPARLSVRLLCVLLCALFILVSSAVAVALEDPAADAQATQFAGTESRKDLQLKFQVLLTGVIGMQLILPVRTQQTEQTVLARVVLPFEVKDNPRGAFVHQMRHTLVATRHYAVQRMFFLPLGSQGPPMHAHA